MILTTRHKRQILIHHPPIYQLVNNSYMKSLNTNFLGSLLIVISHGAHECAISAYQLQKGFTSQQKLRTFSPFVLKKHFSKPIHSISERLCFNSLGFCESVLKPLKFLHRRAFKIILLIHTSLINEDCKNTTCPPKSHTNV